MAKGRKRKAGKRTPSGQISRAGQDPRDHGTPELRKRAAQMKGKGTMALMTDRMCAAGLITDEQNQAAAIFRDLRNRAFGQTGAKIGAYSEMVSEGTLRAIPDIDPDIDPQAKAEAAYRRGWREVHERGQPGGAAELTRIVIDGGAPVTHHMGSFRDALDLLAALYLGVERRGIDKPLRSSDGSQEKHTRKCA